MCTYRTRARVPLGRTDHGGLFSGGEGEVDGGGEGDADGGGDGDADGGGDGEADGGGGDGGPRGHWRHIFFQPRGCGREKWG